MSDNVKPNDTIYGDKPCKVLCWLEDCLDGTCDKIVVVKGWCKRCGICMSVCPVKALDTDAEGYPEVDNEKCISCGTCEIMCPDFAINVTNLKEKKTARQNQ